jgi:anti-anti-sigma factor
MTAPGAPALELDSAVGADDTELVVSLDGELDVSTTHLLAELLEDLHHGLRTVVLDLSRVRFIDSTGVGALMQARRRLESELRTLRIVNPSERAAFVLDLTGLGPLIDGHPVDGHPVEPSGSSDAR